MTQFTGWYNSFSIIQAVVLCFYAALFGICAGGFINIVICRLSNGIVPETGRSMCAACGARLSWRDVVPIVSFIVFMGRCRFCKAPMPLRYPLVEGISGVLAIMCFLRFGPSVQAALAFLVLETLLSVAFIDANTMTIPDVLNIILALIAAAAFFIFDNISISERSIGFFAVSLPMLLLTLIIPEAFGGGDIKLMAVCGFMLGWKLTLTAFFIAVLTGGVYASYLLFKGERGITIAFGPYLCVGIAISMFFGTDIIQMYLNLFM